MMSSTRLHQHRSSSNNKPQPPRNPFQRKRSPPPTSRLKTPIAKSLQQACYILAMGAVLVSLLSWAVPAPPTGGDSIMMILSSTTTGSTTSTGDEELVDRKRGGVRGQVRLPSSTTKSKPAMEPSGKLLMSKHFDADTLERVDGGGLGTDEEESSTDDLEANKKIKKILKRKKKQIDNEEGEGAFGRKEDTDEEASDGDVAESGDSADETSPEKDGKTSEEAKGEKSHPLGVIPDLEKARLDAMRHSHHESEEALDGNNDTVVKVLDSKRDRRNRDGEHLPDGDEEATRDSHERKVPESAAKVA